MQREPIDEALSRLYSTPAAPEGFDAGWRAAVRREETMHMKKTFDLRTLLRRAAPVFAAVVLVMGSLWAGTLDDMPAPQEMAVLSSRSSNSAAKLEAAASYDMAAADYGMAGSGASTGTVLTAQDSRKLVRTADITLSTPAFDTVLQTVQDTLAGMGGYVESLYQYGETIRRINLYMRVPSDRLDEFLGSTEGLGRVTARSESTTDMTTQYADNQARLATLYLKRDRLNELLLKAENVADLIEIESAIADAQYQIDSYESTQRSIDRQVDMSAVSLTLMEETPSDTANADISLAQRIRAAFAASVEWLGEFLRDMLVFLVMILPVIVPLAAVWLVVKLIKRHRLSR